MSKWAAAFHCPPCGQWACALSSCSAPAHCPIGPNVLSIAYTKDKNGLVKDSSIHSFFSLPSRVSPLNVSEECGWVCCRQELGNYKSAHDLLYDTFRDLEADKKKVRTPRQKGSQPFCWQALLCRCATMAIHFFIVATHMRRLVCAQAWSL